LVEVGEVVDNDGNGQRYDQDSADAARRTDQLAPHSGRTHVSVADRCHGDCCPPERLRDADELGALDVVLGEVCEAREDQHPDSNEQHQQTELLRMRTNTSSMIYHYANVLIGRNTSLARLSVRLSVPYGLIARKLNSAGKPKLVLTFPIAGAHCVAIILSHVLRLKVALQLF